MDMASDLTGALLWMAVVLQYMPMESLFVEQEMQPVAGMQHPEVGM
jgi:hypothetical protein